MVNSICRAPETSEGTSLPETGPMARGTTAILSALVAAPANQSIIQDETKTCARFVPPIMVRFWIQTVSS